MNESDLMVFIPELYNFYLQAMLTGRNTSTRRFVRDYKTYTMHIKKLKDVNGVKTHNLRVNEDTLQSKDPVIYINNPIESQLPYSFLSQEQFKKALFANIKKQRDEFQKDRDRIKNIKWNKKYKQKIIHVTTKNISKLTQKNISNKTNKINNTTHAKIINNLNKKRIENATTGIFKSEIIDTATSKSVITETNTADSNLQDITTFASDNIIDNITENMFERIVNAKTDSAKKISKFTTDVKNINNLNNENIENATTDVFRSEIIDKATSKFETIENAKTDAKKISKFTNNVKNFNNLNKERIENVTTDACEIEIIDTATSKSVITDATKIDNSLQDITTFSSDNIIDNVTESISYITNYVDDKSTNEMTDITETDKASTFEDTEPTTVSITTTARTKPGRPYVFMGSGLNDIF